MNGLADARLELDLERERLGGLIASMSEADEHAAQLRDNLAHSESSTDPHRYERRLVVATDQLRHLLRRRAVERTSSSRISPLGGEALTLLDGSRLDYSYERSMPMGSLEGRIVSTSAGPADRAREAVVFSSGMAALTTVVELAVYKFFAEHQRRPRIATLVDYFETGMMVELQRVSCESLAVTKSPAAFLESDADIVLLETLRYNWDLEPVHLEEIARSWERAGRGPSVVIIDSTLTAGSWPVAAFLSALPGHTRVIDVRSGLKLDQQGLELSNLGIAIVHESSDGSSGRHLAQTLRTARSVRGAGLSVGGVAALEPSFLFNAGWSNQHRTSVAANNAEFATRVRAHNALFSRVACPSPADSMSPFTVLTIEDDRLANYELLLGIIRDETARRQLLLDFGASFGFRGHRYETIIPAKRDLICLFKVALGSRRGPTFHGTLDLFAELATYRSVSELRRAYPEARPVRLAL